MSRSFITALLAMLFTLGCQHELRTIPPYATGLAIGRAPSSIAAADRPDVLVVAGGADKASTPVQWVLLPSSGADSGVDMLEYESVRSFDGTDVLSFAAVDVCTGDVNGDGVDEYALATFNSSTDYRDAGVHLLGWNGSTLRSHGLIGDPNPRSEHANPDSKNSTSVMLSGARSTDAPALRVAALACEFGDVDLDGDLDLMFVVSRGVLGGLSNCSGQLFVAYNRLQRSGTVHPPIDEMIASKIFSRPSEILESDDIRRGDSCLPFADLEMSDVDRDGDLDVVLSASGAVVVRNERPADEAESRWTLVGGYLDTLPGRSQRTASDVSVAQVHSARIDVYWPRAAPTLSTEGAGNVFSLATNYNDEENRLNDKEANVHPKVVECSFSRIAPAPVGSSLFRRPEFLCWQRRPHAQEDGATTSAAGRNANGMSVLLIGREDPKVASEPKLLVSRWSLRQNGGTVRSPFAWSTQEDDECIVPGGNTVSCLRLHGQDIVFRTGGGTEAEPVTIVSDEPGPFHLVLLPPGARVKEVRSGNCESEAVSNPRLAIAYALGEQWLSVGPIADAKEFCVHYFNRGKFVGYGAGWRDARSAVVPLTPP